MAFENGQDGFLFKVTGVSTMPVCVCPKVKDMVPFSASSE